MGRIRTTIINCHLLSIVVSLSISTNRTYWHSSTSRSCWSTRGRLSSSVMNRSWRNSSGNTNSISSRTRTGDRRVSVAERRTLETPARRNLLVYWCEAITVFDFICTHYQHLLSLFDLQLCRRRCGDTRLAWWEQARPLTFTPVNIWGWEEQPGAACMRAWSLCCHLLLVCSVVSTDLLKWSLYAWRYTHQSWQL